MAIIRTLRNRWAVRLAAAFMLLVAAWSFSPRLLSFADKGETLPPELALVPPDAFAFVHVRAADVWDQEMIVKLRELLAQQKIDLVKDHQFAPAEIESLSLVVLSAQTIGTMGLGGIKASAGSEADKFLVDPASITLDGIDTMVNVKASGKIKKISFEGPESERAENLVKVVFDGTTARFIQIANSPPDDKVLKFTVYSEHGARAGVTVTLKARRPFEDPKKNKNRPDDGGKDEFKSSKVQSAESSDEKLIEVKVNENKDKITIKALDTPETAKDVVVTVTGKDGKKINITVRVGGKKEDRDAEPGPKADKGGFPPREAGKVPQNAGPGESDAGQFFVVAKLKAPIDRARIIDLTGHKNARESTYKGKTYFTTPSGSSLYFLNDTTFVNAASESAMKIVLARPEQARAGGPLAAALGLAAKKHQMVAGFNFEEPTCLAFKKQLAAELSRNAARSDPLPGWIVAPLLETQSAAFAVDLGKESKVRVQAGLAYRDPQTASDAARALKDGLDLGRILLLGKLLRDLNLEAVFHERARNEILFLAQAAKQAEAALRGAKIEQRQAQVTFEVEAQFDIDYLRGKARIAAENFKFDPARMQVMNQIQSANNLKLLALTMHSYHDVYRKLPTPATYDLNKKDGKPLLSWRVALLPFLEQQELYNQFHHDEPWDSEHNIKLLPKMPKIYAPLPGVKTKEPYTTFYQMVVGPGTVFESSPETPWLNRYPTLGTIPDGTSNTIAMVEASDPVPWTKPADVVYDPKGPLPKLGGTLVEGGFNCALFDGSTRFIKPARPGLTPQEAFRRGEVSETTLRIAIECADGHPLNLDWNAGQ